MDICVVMIWNNTLSTEKFIATHYTVQNGK